MKRLILLILAISLCIPAPVGLAAEDLFSEKDLTEATAAEATALVLNGQTVTIDAPGTYALTGEIANGALRISLQEEGTVWLLLGGVTVHNDTGAALYTENCKKVILTLAEGTENAFSQGTAGSEEEDAAILSRDDLTINGSGALTVTGDYKDGINCRDTLKLAGGTVTVSAADDGVVGKDGVIVGGGALNVTAVNDGVKATNEEDGAKGFVTVAGGEVTIVTSGVRAASGSEGDTGGGANTAESGIVPESITQPEAMTPPESEQPVDGTSQATRPAGKGGGRGGARGGFGGQPFGPMESQGNASTLAESAKGIKAVTMLTISGGTVHINAADDALHAADVTLAGGEVTLASGDDGVHVDNSLLITGGVVAVTQSYEGLEAALITIAGGETSVTASDDGINGAGGDLAETGGEDGTQANGGFFGGDWFSESTGRVVISGGILQINARGDGLDSNGDVEMSGGQVYVNGPVNGANGALDYSGSFTMTGGTLMAVGASGMAQGVSAPSVAGAMVALDGSAGTLSVTDQNGNIMLSMEAAIPYSSAVIYSELLADGGSYTVVTPQGGQTVTMSTEAAAGDMGGWGRR